MSGADSLKEARLADHRLVRQPFRPPAPINLSMPGAYTARLMLAAGDQLSAEFTPTVYFSVEELLG